MAGNGTVVTLLSSSVSWFTLIPLSGVPVAAPSACSGLSVSATPSAAAAFVSLSSVAYVGPNASCGLNVSVSASGVGSVLAVVRSAGLLWSVNITVLPAPSSAYSVRRVVGSWYGPLVSVVRWSDLHSTGIGYTSTGALDSDALLAFAGSSTVFVNGWYDQSGYGNHLQYNCRPTVLMVQNGQLLTTNSVPGLLFADDFSSAALTGVLRAVNVSMSTFNAVASFALPDGPTSDTGFVLPQVYPAGGSSQAGVTFQSSTLLCYPLVFSSSSNSFLAGSSSGSTQAWVNSAGSTHINSASPVTVSLNSNYGWVSYSYSVGAGLATGSSVSELLTFGVTLSPSGRLALERWQQAYYSIPSSSSPPDPTCAAPIVDLDSSNTWQASVLSIGVLPSNSTVFTTDGYYARTSQLTTFSFELDGLYNWSVGESHYPYFDRLVNLTGGRLDRTKGLRHRLGGNTCSSSASNMPSYLSTMAAMAHGVQTLNNTYVFCLSLFWPPAAAAQMAAKIVAAVGDQLLAFELGNEPDGSGLFTYQQYLGNWTRTRDAILQLVPTARFQLFASAHESWPDTFLSSGDLYSYLDSLYSLSFHYYPGSTSISQLMRQDPTSQLAFPSAAHEAGVQLVLGETNSHYLYNKFAMTLYVLDTICSAAAYHIDGTNWHGWLAGYSVFSSCGGRACANSHYYAFWAFAELMGEGGYMTSLYSGLSEQVQVYQAVRLNRTVGFVLINKQPVNMTVSLRATVGPLALDPHSAASAYMKRLLAPTAAAVNGSSAPLWNRTSTTGTTWGGQTLSNTDGSTVGAEVRQTVDDYTQPINVWPYSATFVVFDYGDEGTTLTVS